MKLLNIQKNCEEHDNENATRNHSAIDERNQGGELSAENNPPDNRMPETDDNEPFNIIKYYYGREWSEVEHLFQLPPELEQLDNDADNDWSPEASQISVDSQDDLIGEDVHDLVNVLDDIIRSQSYVSYDVARVVDYLELDLFKDEDIVPEIQDWTWESDDILSEESAHSSE